MASFKKLAVAAFIGLFMLNTVSAVAVPNLPLTPLIEAVSNLLRTIITNVKQLLDGLLPMLNDVLGETIDNVQTLLSNIITNLNTVLDGLLDGLLEVIGTGSTGLLGSVNDLLNGVVGSLTDILGSVGGVVSGLTGALGLGGNGGGILGKREAFRARFLAH